MYEGLKNEEYMARKKAAESKLRKETESGFSEADNPWKQIDAIYEELRPYGACATLLNPRPYRGESTAFIHHIANFMEADEEEKKEEMKEKNRAAAQEAKTDRKNID